MIKYKVKMLSSWYNWFIAFLFLSTVPTVPELPQYTLYIAQDGTVNEPTNLGGFIYTAPDKDWTIELESWNLDECITKLENFEIDPDGKVKLDIFIKALREESEDYLVDQIDNIYYVTKQLLPIFLVHNNNPTRSKHWTDKRYKLIVKEE